MKLESLYEMCPPNGVVVEVGVWKGDNAAMILGSANPRLLFLVDIWRFQADSTNNCMTGTDDATIRQVYRSVVDRFYDDDRVVVMRLDSLSASSVFADGSIDMVYIDACHLEEAVFADLAAWFPKVRPGGLLCGHDWNLHPGVRAAVDRFFKEHPSDAKLQYIAGHWSRPLSYGIRKLQ